MRPSLAKIVLIALSLVAASAGVAHGPSDPVGGLDTDRSIEISQQAIGQSVGDYAFLSAGDGSISLAQLRGRPVIVSLIYTSCADICPMLTQRLRRAVADAQRLIGSDRFAVITVGFDTRHDTPTRMAAFARAQGVDLPNWRFVSGDERVVAALARDLGFSYAPTAGGFVHVSQTTILDRGGKVYRQVYGDDFPAQVFMEPLKEVVYGTAGTFMDVGGLLDRVRFLCTVYDPSLGRYRISYAIVASFLSGVVSLGATGFVISRAWLRSRRV